MDYAEWFASRLAALRQEKGVSARDMSLSLGQSESYINKIENRRTLPSMMGFFYICEYLKIEPSQFFDLKSNAPEKTDILYDLLKVLPPDIIDHITALANDIKHMQGER